MTKRRKAASAAKGKARKAIAKAVAHDMGIIVGDTGLVGGCDIKDCTAMGRAFIARVKEMEAIDKKRRMDEYHKAHPVRANILHGIGAVFAHVLVALIIASMFLVLLGIFYVIMYVLVSFVLWAMFVAV